MKQKRPPTMSIGPSRKPKVKAPASPPVEKKAEPAPAKEPWFGNGNDPQTLSRDFTTTLVQAIPEITSWSIQFAVPIFEAVDWLYCVRQEILLKQKIEYEKSLLADVSKVKQRPAVGMLGFDESHDALRNHLAIIVARELEACYEDISRARRKINDFRMRYPLASPNALINMCKLRPGPKWPEDRP